MSDVRRELKPRNLGEILREAFAIYGRHFLAFITIAIVIAAPLAILQYFVQQHFTAEVPEENADLDTVLHYISVSLQGTGLVMAATLLLYPLVAGALIYGTSAQHLRHPIDLGEACRFSCRRAASLIIAMLIVTAVVGLLSLSIIGIPLAIYLGVKWICALQAAVVERRGPTQALSRSSQLVKGTWWRVFGLFLVVALVAVGIQIGLGILFAIPATALGGTAQDAVTIVSQMVTVTLTTPFIIVATTLIYYDLRVRKEGFNIDIMAQELGIGTGGMGQAATP